MAATRFVAPALALAFFFTLIPAASGQADEAWSIEDPADDLSPGGPGIAEVVPGTPFTRQADLRAFTIEDEDETQLFFNLEVEELHVAEGIIDAEYVDYEIFFQLLGTEYSYRLYVSIGGLTSNPETSGLFTASGDWYGYLCIETESIYCHRQPIDVELDDEADRIEIRVTKAALMGVDEFDDGFYFYYADGADLDLPEALPSGAQLGEWRVTSDYGMPPIYSYIRFYDLLPGVDVENVPYTFRTAAANTKIQIALADEAQEVSAEVGRNQSVPFVFTNGADGKRLIQLEYGLDGPQEAVGRYHVTGPPSITVPAGSTRNFTFALEVDEGATGQDGVSVTLKATSVGHEDELAYASFPILPGVALGPGNNALHLYAESFVAGAADESLCGTAVFECVDGLLSASPSPPEGASSEDRIDGSGLTFGSSTSHSFYIYGDQPLAAPITFEDDGMVELTINLVAQAEVPTANVRTYVSFSTPDRYDLLFEADDTVTIGTSPTAVTLTGPHRLGDEPVLPAGTTFFLYVGVSMPNVNGAIAWAGGGVSIDPKDSALRLPLGNLSEDFRNDVTASPFQVALAGDNEEFVNPGEARRFDLNVLNQSPDPHRVTLDATTAAEGWRVMIRPGRVYDLDAGDLITVNVLVHAPSNAAEADIANVIVTATADDGSVVSVALRATVTNGDDFPDDALATDVDEDAQGRLVSSGSNDTPAPGLLAVLGAVALLAMARRRRKA